MPFTVTMPKLSPTMEEGSIAKWHKKEGEFVEAGELLLEVSTDKATVEYNAVDAGWVRKILIQDGGEAKVNQPIGIFTEDQNESIENYQPTGDAAPSASGAVLKEEEIAKATEEAPKQKTPQTRPQTFSAPEPPQAKMQVETLSEKPAGRILASPLAKKLAKEQGLDLSTVKGSGPNQRIMSRDLAHARPESQLAFGSRQQPQIPSGTFIEETMTPMRKVISQRLQESKSFIPHFYVQKSINAAALVSLKDQLQEHGVKVSINDCLVKASALALRDHPVVNSGFNANNNTFIRFKTIDVCVAVSVEGGLITPIVRHADYKNLVEISSEIRELAKRAKQGKLNPSEYKGGSFTVSNLGMYGITDFQAIINPPQAAILSVSSILDVPVVNKGVIEPGKIMNVTLSCDHRVVDGVAAAEFLKTLQKHLENPVSLVC